MTHPDEHHALRPGRRHEARAARFRRRRPAAADPALQRLPGAHVPPPGAPLSQCREIQRASTKLVVHCGSHTFAWAGPSSSDVVRLLQARRLATAYHCYGLDFRGHDESAHAPWLPPLARPAAADAPLRTEHPLGESAGCHLDHFVEDIFAVVQWLTSRGASSLRRRPLSFVRFLPVTCCMLLWCSRPRRGLLISAGPTECAACARSAN